MNLLHSLQCSLWMDELAPASSPAGQGSCKHLQSQPKLPIVSPDCAARMAAPYPDRVCTSGWLSMSRSRDRGVHARAWGTPAPCPLCPNVQKQPPQRRKSHLEQGASANLQKPCSGGDGQNREEVYGQPLAARKGQGSPRSPGTMGISSSCC